jgi:hypothetical protein
MTRPWSLYFLTRRHNTISRIFSYYEKWRALKQKPKPVGPPHSDQPPHPGMTTARSCMLRRLMCFSNTQHLPDVGKSGTLFPDLWKTGTNTPASLGFSSSYSGNEIPYYYYSSPTPLKLTARQIQFTILS